MEKESLVQPSRRLMFFETAEELPGHLQVPDLPAASAGYANIYRGTWTNPQGHQVEVAIKELKNLIPSGRHTDAGALKTKRDKRMKREVYVWSQIKHPNLHPLLGFRLEPQPQLISSWCRHGNLTQYLRNNPGLSRLHKLRLIFQAACGLEYLHAQNPPICHADVKPENVLINDLLLPALSDFGLSRVLDGLGHRTGLTTSDGVKGTYNYLAPEIFKEEGPRPTLETDVYAFGGLILTVMSGKAPFSGLKPEAILFRVVMNQPPRPSDHQHLPSSDPLWSLLYRCWDMTPEARPSIGEILREILKHICTEELDHWSRLGPPSSAQYDNPESSEMDLDTPGETAAWERSSLLDSGAVASGGSTYISKQTRLSEGAFLVARKTLDSLEVNSKTIPVIGRYITAAGDVGSILLDLTRAMDRNARMAYSLGLTTLTLVGRLEQLGEEWIPRQMAESLARIADVQRELQSLRRNIEEWYSSGLFLNAFSKCDHPAGRRECEGSAKRALEEIQLLLALGATQLASEIELQEQHRRLLNLLGNGDYGVRGNAIEDIICSPGTRLQILEQIDDWVRGSSASGRVLWIRGMAGRGKSTIASTVAHRWKFRASCAIFHFRGGQDTPSSRLVCALARQLGSGLNPEVKNAILESISGNQGIANQQLIEQFKTLLIAPFGKLEGSSYPILIIVDALNECQNAKDVVDFVTLIHRHSSSFPANVKFLLTYRPEALLLRALEPNRWNEIDLDSAPEVREDLTRFICDACAQIRDEHRLANDWPSPEDVSRLVEMSQGSFQCARTTITYISNGSPVDRLRGLLQRRASLPGAD